MRCTVIVTTGLFLFLLMEVGYSIAIGHYEVRPHAAAKASTAFFRGPIAATLANLAP